ncbi:HipA domain-containing protein [Sphingomonas donggukensis]|uniref:HipA domain-containing protein n=1 Tax=Sphingomonas donggukensis TaxID=2949093 RepID=A0ABY4TU32_9SPHN|nr:HipA domain-containing protein [Sphingomonas donggukensis]URW75902.1 HipA domain-containing protein [Sphingomonas donggukensis]
MTYKRQFAGTLREVGAGTRFEYHDGWNETIACSLPVSKRDHYWPTGLFPFFEHLAPEGWLRARQARAARASDQDDLGLLLRFGADCIGAVGVRPPGGLPEPGTDGDALEAAVTTPGRTLSGVQRKLLAHRADSGGFVPSHQLADPATHIAKLNAIDRPTLVQNEALSLGLAREVLGSAEITEASIGAVAGIDGIALLVERFDRVGENQLRLEDFAQILGRPHGRDFNGKYNGSYEEAAGVVAAHSARARIDLDRFFRLVVFNFVIGNADAHLKNFSLLERPEGLRLSPAYDLVSTLLYDFDPETGLEIGGRKRPIDTLDRGIVEAFGAEIGLPPAAVRRALDQLGQRFAKAKTPALPERIEPTDFRLRYRDLVTRLATKILA